MPQFDWTAHYIAECKAAESRFAAALRKVARMVAASAEGADNDAEVMRAFDRLYFSRRYGANCAAIQQFRESADKCCSAIAELKGRWIEAREIGRAVRRAARDAEIARLTREIREAENRRREWR